MATKRKYLRAIRTNAGIEARYRRDLDKLIAEMNHSVRYWVEAAYKEHPPALEVAMDALPSQELYKRIQELSKRWIKRFDDMAEKIAERFVQSGKRATDASMMAAFRDAGWTVQFKPTRYMQDMVNASIKENIGLIKRLPQANFERITGAVMRGFTNGYDLKRITDELEKYGAESRRHAAFVARDQANKLRATTEQARRVELGLFEAEWVHSSAGKVPRPSHVKAGKDKLRFDVRRGALIDGEYILPAYLPSCRCTSRTILPF